MAIEKVIVLEADAIIRSDLEGYLRRCRYDVASTSNIDAARDYLSRDNFDVIFLDINLPNGTGPGFLREIQIRPQKPLAVVTTNSGSIESAIDCTKNGAFDYLVKPFTNEQIDSSLSRAQDFIQLIKVNRFLSQESDGLEHDLLGCSPEIEHLRLLIRKVARTNATVLIQGESGTGKEAVARAIYKQSSRSRAPFIKVNCAAIPENLIESEFFGHEKGAFTGAMNKREGRFELAHGGTILLDEISEISPTLQAKLLRVLQEREFERVGGNRTIKVDVRVIATTNRNLEQSVEKREFRQDLYFRLNVVPICVPPLRERPADVVLLRGEFLARFCRLHGIHAQGFTEQATMMLDNYSWPGNVRELLNVIERAVILCGDSSLLEPEHLGLTGAFESGMVPAFPATPAAKNFPTQTTPESKTNMSPNRFLTLAEVEKQHILTALDHCKGNRTHAAKLLDVSIRTLRNKLHEYNGTASKFDDNPMTAGI
jgi:DNA-binding NtrC family response regulator